jgi:hypothetical protein
MIYQLLNISNGSLLLGVGCNVTRPSCLVTSCPTFIAMVNPVYWGTCAPVISSMSLMEGLVGLRARTTGNPKPN